ncbi:MAG TPA: hypothetical protein ENN09_06665 [Planctomycetes bacterium]|nr:hypothetical protein [Planctomycetota bacterium]
MRLHVVTLVVLAVFAAGGCTPWGRDEKASFAHTPDNPWPFESVQFIDTTNPCCSVIVAWHWVFEGGFPSTSAAQNPTVTWTEEGVFNVTFTIRTKEGLTSSASKRIVVGDPTVNNPPFAYDQSVSVVGINPIDITLTGMDPEGQPLTFFINSQPPIGTIDDANIPLVVYLPPAAGGFTGVTSFTFYCHDGVFPSNVATIWIGVDNNAPTAMDDFITARYMQSTNVMLIASDPDGDPIDYIVDTLPLHGVLSGEPPNLIYTPFAGYLGPDSFTFHATDHVLDSPTATISIEVIMGSNNPPVAYDMNEITFMGNPIDIYLDGSDPDEDPITYWIISMPTNGMLIGASTPPYEVTPSGSNLVIYEPNPDFMGDDSFEFRVFDGQDWSEPATVFIIVLGM